MAKSSINFFMWSVIGFVAYKMLQQNNVVGIAGVVEKSKWMPPYKTLGVPELGWKTETNFKFAQNKIGVYIIKKNGVVVYVGCSTQNVYAQMLRHFEPYKKYLSTTLKNTNYNQRKQLLQSGHKKAYHDDYETNDYRVRVIITNTAKQAEDLERALIKKYNPADNFNYNDGSNIFSNAENKILDEYADVPF